MSDTIRSTLEAQKKRHAEGDFPFSFSDRRACLGCRLYHPCEDYQAAVAMLHILDECDMRFPPSGQELRLVPDPEEAPDA